MLLRRQIVDELTIAAVRRQFRELVRNGDPNVPIEERVFDSHLLYKERVQRGQVKQRYAPTAPGATEGAAALVDLTASDGGYSEWRRHHWEPLIAGAVPVGALSYRQRMAPHQRGGGRAGGPFGFLQNLFRPGGEEALI